MIAIAGKWITFEGIGGSGKSTQVRNVFDWLVANNYSVVMTKEPGGTGVGEEFRKIVKEPRTTKLSAFTELMLFEADRHETVKQVIQPAIAEGKIVISDRGIDGSIAYQGFGRGLDLNLIKMLTLLATEGAVPDLTIFIDVSIEKHIERTSKREDDEPDQFDRERISFQEKVKEGFSYCAKLEPNRVHTINGNHSQEEVTNDILDILKTHIL